MPEPFSVLPGPGVQQTKSPNLSPTHLEGIQHHGGFPSWLALGKLWTYTLSFSLLHDSRKFPPGPFMNIHGATVLPGNKNSPWFLSEQQLCNRKCGCSQIQELVSGGWARIFEKLLVLFVLSTISKIIKNGNIYRYIFLIAFSFMYSLLFNQ